MHQHIKEPIRTSFVLTHKGTKSKAASIRFGGLPRLPDALEWPEDLHFFAEISLEKIPSNATLVGRDFDLPKFVRSGTVFVFLPLKEDEIVEVEPKILFWPEPVDGVEGREPPEDLEEIGFSDWPDGFDGVSGCGRLISPSISQLEPKISYFAPAALMVAARTSDHSDQDVYDMDSAYADFLASFGISYTPRPMQPKSVADSYAEDLPLEYKTLFQQGAFQFTWDYVFEFARLGSIACYRLALEELAMSMELGNTQKHLPKFTKKLEGWEADQKQVKRSDKASFWSRWRFSNCNLPTETGCIDTQLEDWVHYARVNYYRARGDTELSNIEKAAFVRLLQRLEALMDTRKRPELLVLAAMQGHTLGGMTVALAMHKALHEVCEELSDIQSSTLDYNNLPKAQRG